MQTQFTLAQLADSDTKEADRFSAPACIAALQRDLSNLRALWAMISTDRAGAFILIKDMLENDRDPTERVVRHIDRCLSLSCLHDDLSLGGGASITCISSTRRGHRIETQ